MPNVGIVAEYNPFHNGHAYNIEKARLVSGCDNVIVCMSGSFVQRGEPACFDKFTRAGHALLGGADMVIEMPDILSCASAERFAFGGIRLLTASGIVDSIEFGSECGDIEKLWRVANEDIHSDSVKRSLSEGQTYARAVAENLSCNDTAFSAAPNDILGIEYLRQIKKLSPSVSAFAIPRTGNGYNKLELGDGFASASAIRAALHNHGTDTVSKYVPGFVFEDMRMQVENGRFPASLENLSEAALYALRMLSIDGIRNLSDVTEGLENLFFKHACTSSAIDEMLLKIKSKRYTMARLKRIVIAALIGSTKELLQIALKQPDALFIRVLGVRKEKLYLLSQLSEKAMLPVVTTFGDTEKLSENALRVLDHTRYASSVRALGCPVCKASEDDFSHPMIIV